MTTTQQKQRKVAFPAKIKALDAAEAGGEGRFEAIVSVFNTVDLGGDKVMPGAFTDSIKRWKESGDPIPIIWSHQWDDLKAHVGQVLEAEEVEAGLRIVGELDVDEDNAAGESSRILFRRMQKRRIKEFSFAYDVLEEERVAGANELRKLEIIEVGPTLKGMHPDTQLIGTKNADGTKTYVQLAGSLEERARQLRVAVSGWAKEAFPPPADAEPEQRAYAWVEATFDDRVLVAVEDFRDPEKARAAFYEVAYSLGDDGTVSLGESQEVEVVGDVRPKAKGRKAGRVLSAKNESALKDAVASISDGVKAINQVLASVAEGEQDAAGKAGGKSEEPDGAKDEASAGAKTAVSTELLAHEIGAFDDALAEGGDTP